MRTAAILSGIPFGLYLCCIRIPPIRGCQPGDLRVFCRIPVSAVDGLPPIRGCGNRVLRFFFSYPHIGGIHFPPIWGCGVRDLRLSGSHPHIGGNPNAAHMGVWGR